MESQSFADLEMLQAALANVCSPWVRELDLRVLEARAGEVVAVLPVTQHHVDAAGVLAGQALAAAAETAMMLAVMTRLGGFKPMATVQLQTSFLRPIAGTAGAVRVVARVLRMTRTLVFGEVHVLSADDELAAHATTTVGLQ